jgi:hypothetical protein
MSSIDDVGSRLIDATVTGAFIAHRHALQACPWVANDTRIVCPRCLDKQAIALQRPAPFTIFGCWWVVAHGRRSHELHRELCSMALIGRRSNGRCRPPSIASSGGFWSMSDVPRRLPRNLAEPPSQGGSVTM